MKLRQLMAASLLSLGVCAASAQTPAAGPGQRPGAEEVEKRCQANPERCAQIKEDAQKRREEWKKKCDADPKACEEKKAQLQRRRAERKQKCDADPKACEERKAQRKEYMQGAPRPAPR